MPSPSSILSTSDLTSSRSSPVRVNNTNTYNASIISEFVNRLIIEVLGSMALAERGLSEGSPIKPKEPLGPQPDLKASADD
ncbi:hypothetical protein HAPAU_26890 [Halalkalicoccus paucihalophilus]|uniref:Uncharacterized protein n=1 Tax=Halalkalicoccus paucihalophilus TaxID=1008153 RepID=A0A151ABP0_9EURY|nr:hypothetical protein HAPAU_26890 [Halalkalicoccus paucihalophilus]